MTLVKLSFLVLAQITLLSGCMRAGMLAGDIKPYPAMEPIEVVTPVIPAATPGAIYQAGSGLSLYSDHRAQNVGDLVTILLIENTSAKSNANTSTAKKSAMELSAPSIFGRAPSIGGKNILDGSLKGDRSFSGNGNTAQSNQLQGSITVTVIQRLPNGNLVVQGNKNMRLNQGNELVQIQGIIRPIDISSDNTIASNKVADARIAYGGRGTIAQSNTKGWLSKFFSSGLYPY